MFALQLHFIQFNAFILLYPFSSSPLCAREKEYTRVWSSGEDVGSLRGRSATLGSQNDNITGGIMMAVQQAASQCAFSSRSPSPSVDLVSQCRSNRASVES